MSYYAGFYARRGYFQCFSRSGYFHNSQIFLYTKEKARKNDMEKPFELHSFMLTQ